MHNRPSDRPFRRPTAVWWGLVALAGLAASTALTGVASAQQAEPAVEPARQLSTNPTPVRARARRSGRCWT